jgi:hypothetical protein
MTALTTSGTLYAWGIQSSGQLGLGDTIARSSPTQVGSSSWRMVSAGSYNTAGITSTGTLFVWGNNAGGAGQIGDGTIIARSSPVQIGSSSWTMVLIANTTTLAIRSDGTLWSWGGLNFGQLGTAGPSRSSPVQIGLLNNWRAIYGGWSVFGITTSNKLFAWGWNSNGQLGDGTTVNKSSPVQIGTSSWLFVNQGFQSTTTLAIKFPS